MKIKTVKINNFRSIADETVHLSAYNSFVGPNGAGKSTTLNALNVFFGEINNFSDEDFHARNTEEPIKITVTFDELGEEAREEFKHYARAGQLVVHAEICKAKDGTFKRTIRGERLIFQPFREYFEAKGAKDRGAVFKKLQDSYKEIRSATNDGDRSAALAEYEESLPEGQKELVPSGGEFFGISKGVHKFQRHLCWVYVPAVKDASSESEEAKSSHLGKLIQHTIRSQMNYDAELERIRTEAFNAYTKLLSDQSSHLEALQGRLSERLQAAVMTEAGLKLGWKKDEKSVAVQDPIAQVLLSERGYVDRVDKFGHGLQRSFLLVILQELMAVDSAVSPTLILGCEEPELYQHPPQARHLAEILMELAGGDAQVLLTTHSPYFIDVEYFDGIKVFRNSAGAATITSSSFSEVLDSYNAAFVIQPLRNEDQARTKLAIQTQPKFNEIFFAERVVVVEGISDLACIEAYMRLSGKRSDFQKSGATIVVCEGKSSLALMILIMKSFKIPYHAIFDCDSEYDEKFKENPGRFREPYNEHIRDNNAILELSGHETIDGFPIDHIFLPNLTGWRFNIEKTLEAEFGEDMEACLQAGRDAVGNLRNSQKHPLYIAAAMSAAWGNGKTFPVLQNVVDRILA
ncbi:ATP-dependent endonuclease [Ruegeria litorea]|uniref:ATP-dependent endonuclease n=1 Tax=Falsiruegeria litorea TaxID=1280831 RepID=A0ABS5WMS8_9RHOB|nr:AAA family ATPase [Falsiruegeria litorea]MBT3140433.1 ATP-dependent endonuclease [Falsiruegeria litorea]